MSNHDQVKFKKHFYHFKLIHAKFTNISAALN